MLGLKLNHVSKMGNFSDKSQESTVLFQVMSLCYDSGLQKNLIDILNWDRAELKLVTHSYKNNYRQSHLNSHDTVIHTTRHVQFHWSNCFIIFLFIWLNIKPIAFPLATSSESYEKVRYAYIFHRQQSSLRHKIIWCDLAIHLLQPLGWYGDTMAL